uniref:Uncharacterized protein n=1 Tax=Avena sativa TaxID=4498 RepID=A0ACD5Y215_AVESA
MATEFDSGGSKKRRMDEEGQQAVEEDRISALPEALRLDILGLLPFKSAIRTGALSTQWRALWTRRWPAPGSLDFRLGPHDSSQPLLESLERRGQRRLDRFSLSFQIGLLNPEDFGRCLDYAATCDVADLDVNLLDVNDAYDLCFSFGALPANPHLARLSLSGICVFPTVEAWYLSELRYLPRPYSVLEVIHLHRVTVEDVGLYHLVAACPRLRTLDIRYCDEDLRRAVLAKYRAKAKANLKSVTIVECESLADVRIRNSSSLRSFRYSGAYLAADAIPTRSVIEDLYICFGGPACRQVRSRRVVYDKYGRPCKLRGCWLDRLIKLCNLSVLTLCSSALRRVSAKARARSTAGRNAASCKLQNLREVQLLMFAMCNDNLDDIMAFLMTCCTPRLERLFVQLPTRSNQYKPNEEPSESEEDGSEEELPEVESSSGDLSEGEESEEDQLEQEESEEEESEEDHSQEDESEEDYSQDDESEEDHSQDNESEEDHSQDDGSEEDHSQDDRSEEDHSQDKSEEEGSEEEHPKEDESDENGLAEGQSKDGSKKELSDGGQSAKELLGDGCGNLMLLKMMNFTGHHNEMRLVSFVLKKSGCLNQLILFTPKSDHPEGPQKDHLNISDFLQTKLLPLKKASPHAQIILSEPDAAGIKPFHSETFVKV